MDKKYIYRCEDSAEGIFSAIYDAWASVHRHEENRIEVRMGVWEETLLFADYIDVVPDAEKSEKVQRSVRLRISEEAYEMVMKAVLSQEAEKGEIIYRFLIFAYREGARACRSYGNPWAMKLFEAVRNFDNESHHLKGFLRFDEQENGLLLARYASKNNVMGDLMEHFSERLNTEDFMIFDEKRRIVGVHKSSTPWFIYRLNDEEYRGLLARTEAKDSFVELWKVFHSRIAIAERENRSLQRNNLPLRFRPYMTEFRETAQVSV
ncbi:MAG: TIGR03915 family putative DNA repair protein [Lachnospiraceae bacterium]|nr:TIGR03915 family putative DNA repair protein [Lachnospiraceae bacterium]